MSVTDAAPKPAPLEQPSAPVDTSVVDTPYEPTTVDKALMRYDLALAPILARTGGIGLVSHHELRAILLAFRAGLAGAFNYMADPTDDEAPTGESRDTLAEQRAAARAASVDQPAPLAVPSVEDLEPENPPAVAPIPGEAAETVVTQDEAQNASIIAESQSNLTPEPEEYVAS